MALEPPSTGFPDPGEGKVVWCSIPEQHFPERNPSARSGSLAEGKQIFLSSLSPKDSPAADNLPFRRKVNLNQGDGS